MQCQLTTLNIAGSGSLKLTANTLGGTLTTTIVSTSTGTVELAGALTAAANYTGAAGVDKVTAGAAATGTINTGAGDDTITASTLGTGNPLVNEKIKQIKGQNRHYLAHEYFNRDWHPMHFGTMAEWLEPAKLTYACSAHYLDYVEAVNLTPEQQAFLKDIHDPMFKQTVRDFMVNQQFRKDYWVKGARRLRPNTTRC